MKSSKRLHSLAFVVLLSFAAFLTRADVSLTPATGGTGVSADLTGGAFTALTGPVLAEGATGDIGTGTIVLNCPAGFEFDTNSAVTVAITGSGSGNDVALLSNTADVTPSTITIQVTGRSDGTETSTLTFSGISARPTAGTPLASGTMTQNGTATFTLASIPADNYGALNEVAGTVSALAFSLQPGSATAGAAFGAQPTVVTVDQFGNASTSGLGANVNVTVSLTTGTGPLQGTSTLDIGTTAGNGTVSFTDLQIDVAGTDKQLTASATGLTSATSSVFAVAHGAATALAIQQQPSSSAMAGVAFAQQPVVAIQDAFGNLVNDDNSTVITATRNAGSGTLQGTVNATVSSGIATFTDLAHNVANNITITFSSGSLTTTTSATIAVSPATADHLVFTLQPGSATAGSAFGSQPSLLSQDAFGNASTVGLSANLVVTMALTSGSGTLAGTTTEDIGTAAGNGSVTFTDLRIDSAGSKQLTASASGLTSATSSSFNVAHGSASKLTIQQQPSSAASAGVAFAQQPVVRIEDDFGNLISDDNSTVVTAARNAGSGTLQGTVNATVSGGVATFTDLSHNVAGTITITFSSGSLTPTTSSTIAINAAAADHLVFTTQPGSATAGAAFGAQPALVSQDQFGNASTAGLPASLSVSIALTSGSGTLQGTTTQDIGTSAGNGTVAFTDLRIDTAGSKQLTASTSGLTSATSGSFSVAHAAASKLTIQQQPSSTATAGVAFGQQPIVRIEDTYGNLINDDNASVITVTRNAGSGTLQGTVNATVSGGVATYTDLAHNVAGNITITFSSGSLTSATSDSVAINPAAADHLVFTTQPASATAGAAFGTQPALVSQDQFGNASTVGLPANLDVNVTLSSGTGILQGTATQDIGTSAGNGTVTFTDLRIDAAGSKQLTAAAIGLTSATTSSFSVSHASAAALAIQQQPSSTATAGVAFAQQPVVQIQDAFGNLIDDDNSSVITATRNAGSGTLQGTVNATVSGGVATYTDLSHNVAGNISITFSSGLLTSATTANIAVSPAAADHLVFTVQPGSATAGTAFGTQPALISEDQFGNASSVGLPASLNVNVTLSSGSGTLQGTTTQDIGTSAGNGTATFTNLRIDTAGSKQLTASASGLASASSSLFTVSHASASALTIQQQPSSTATAGVAFAQQPIIQIQDAFGNLINDDNSTVITATRNAGSGTLQGTINATVSSGIATYTDLAHNVAGNITITFSSGSLTSATSSTVAVSAAAANHLVFTTQPASATAGAAFGIQPTLVSQDQFGNPSTVGLPASLNVNVTLSSGSGTLQGTTTQDIGTAAGNGTVAFTNLRIDTAGNKQLTASASGLTGATSSTFAVNHASASALTIQQQPSTNATAGVEFAQQPIVRIEDSFGNLIDDDNSSAVTAARNAGSGTLQGTVNMSVSAGVATFTNLSYNVAENITITFSSGSLTSATSDSITVSPAPADHLVFTTQPGSATAGTPFGSQPAVVSQDQFGNASTVGLPANLTVTMSLSSGTGSLLGTTTQDIGTAAGNGAVMFTDLEIDVAGTGKQLTASAIGLTSATSTAFSVAHAAASTLVIQQQPSSSAIAGVAFAQQPIIQIQDNYGNLIDDDNSTVVTATRNAGTGTLQGTVNATAAGGVAAFTDLSHNVAGNITITFSSGSLSAATSTLISVSPSPANHLVFVTQPGSATAGSAFGTQPSLISEDQFGNPSAVGLPASLSVTMTLSSGTGALQGTTSQDIGTAAGNGTVTFTNLRIDTAGIKHLTANASGLTGSTTGAFAVSHATASTLTIQQQPSTTATAGVEFAQQPIVRIEDSFGNLINEDNSSVVTAARSAGSGTLQGTLSQTVSGGVATFTNLSHNVAGNITIAFSSGSLSSATSTSIAITPAAADHLVFTTQPGLATAGSAFGTQPALISEDQFGNASAVGLPANLNVAVALSAGTGPLQGTATQDIGTAAGNGSVTFTDLRIDVAGTDKQLTASASGLTSASSSVFTVNHAAASALVIQQQPSSTATAGIAFAQQPIIAMQDAFGNLINDDNTTVITAARNAGTGTLQGTLTATVSGGVASFVNLAHNVAGNITITFSSGSLVTATSSAISISAAAANHLVFTSQPGSATAGSVFGSQPSLISQDAFGNPSVAGLPANLNVTVSLSTGTGPLQGTTTQDIGTAAGNGTVTFSNLRIDAAGNNKQLTASASGLASATSSTFTVDHATASALAIQQQPSSTATAGVLFVQQPIIQIQDAFGNLINDDNSSVVTAVRNAGSGTLQGTLNLTVVGGVATYTNLSHNVAGNITIDFSSGSLTTVTSSTVAVSPAAADHLVFTIQPGAATAGSAFGTQPSLISEDQFGNTSAVGLPASLNVTMTLSSGIGTLQGTTTQDIGTAAGNGAVTFTNLRIDTAGPKQLTASASGLSSATSGAFVVSHAAAAALAIQQQPSSTAAAGTMFAQQPIVLIEDAFGNLVDDDDSTVVTAARNAGSGTLQGTLSATASGGVVSFANLSHNVVGTITILFTSGSLGAAESTSINITPAVANHLVFVTQPGSATAGSVFGSQPSIKSKDVFGNDSTVGLPANLNVTISLAAGTGPLQGTTTQDIGTAAGNGLVSFSNLRIDAAGNDKQLSAAASGLSSALSSVFVVNHATATQLGIQTPPSSTAVAGQLFAQQPVVQVQDQFGNLISEDNATSVTAARNSGSGTLQGTLTLTAVGGTIAYTNLSHNVANDITISFSASGFATTNSDTVTITPAAADHLVFTTQPGSATAGSIFGSEPTLVAQDPFGNNSSVGLASHLNLTIALTTGSGILQGITTQDIGTVAGNGAATFTDLRIDVAGLKALTASAAGLTSVASGAFSVAHGAPSTLTIQQQPSSSATAGVVFAQQPIVRIEDGFGNLITEDNSTVITATRNAGSGTLQGTVGVTAVNGVATFANLSHNVASSITITFSGGSLASATSSTINVSPAAASKLAILTQPGASATAGQAFSPQPSVAIEDQFNNIITSDNSSLVVVTRTFGGALQGTLSATAANGIATFVNLSETEATTMTLDFTSGSLTGARSSSITVNPAAADHLTITTQPSSSATAGTPFATQPVVQIQDQFNNVVTTDNTSIITVVRSGGSGTLQGTTSITASSGVATFGNLFHTVAGNITLLFSSGSLSTALSSSIQINPANANHLTFTIQPASATAGSVFGVQPVVRSFDAYGNASAAGLASSLPVSVTLQAGTGPLQGTTTMDIGTANGNGTVSFADLRIDAAGIGKQLQASASGLTSATSSSFAVAHASAAQLVIQTQPSTNATAGDNLTNQPVIQIADNYGNTITEDNSTAVTASLRGGGTGLEGTVTLTPASGIVTFTNLYFDFAANVQLDFNGGSFATVTSDVIHVGPAAGSRLLIDTQPGATATAGQLFSPQPVVSLHDRFGNVITADNTTQVTVTRSSGGTLLGTTTLTAVNGVFSFTDLAETVSGPMTLTFASVGLNPIVSSSITINAGPVAQLSVHTQPSSPITAGQLFPQQPVVWLLDSYGNLCTTDSSTQVTATRVNGVGNLQGTTTMTAVNGVVTYTNLTHFNATTMNLQFTAGSISTTSSPVTVNAGPAALLTFTQTPAGQAGHVLATQPIVEVTDSYGNVPTSIPASTPVTLAMSSGSGNLFGTTTLDASGSGIATFTDIQINAPGTKQLVASAPGLASGLSASFTLTGTAQPLASYGSASIGRATTALWVGNFRGASTARDAVAVNHDDMMLTLRMSKDDGTFDAPATISLPAHPIAARAADLNGDGFDDLVVTYDDTNIVSVLLSTGSHGTNFAAPVPYVFSALQNPQATSMFLADLNGDGKTDLVVATAADNSVQVLFGTAGAAFTSPVTYAVGANPVWINVSDVNADGSQDIVTANKDDATISILYGSPGGTFATSRTVTLGGNPQPVRVTTPDINRDGKLDLAVVNYASNTVSILVQQSNGSFLLSSNYTVGTHPTDFFLRDIDGDGFSDLAVLNSGSGTIDVLFNRGTGSYVSQSTIAAGAVPTALFGGKFVSSVNLNGLLVADSANNSIAVYMFAGPTATSASINVNENTSGLIILGAHNPLFPQIYNFAITQYPTNGTITGTAPTLTYTPNHEYVGADTLKFRADVNGVTSAVATVSISVLAVNHAPSFTMSTNRISLLQGSSFSLRNFITSKNTGAANESTQKIDFVVTNTDPTLYTTQPKVATDGTLTFKLAPLARGTNDLLVYAHDNGGTSRGGTNVSATQVLSIVALRFDHAPVVKAIPTQTILEDSAPTNITITVTDLDDPIENISVTPVSLNESIIPSANILVSGPTTETNFDVSFVPAPDANGVATIQLHVFDGQDTTIATFKVNVIAVDDQPSFDLPDDEVYALQDSLTVTVSNFCTSINAGAANETAQVLTFVIGNTNKAAFAVQPTIDKFGTLKFRPAIGYSGTNFFSVYLKDSGTTAYGGVNISDTNFFSIGITTNNFRHITGTYNSLFYEDTGVTHQSSGFLTFTLGYTRSFSGKVIVDGGTYALTGQFDTNGVAHATVKRGFKPALTANLQVDLLGDTEQVSGDVSNGTWDATLLGDRQHSAPPAGTIGKFNVAFVGSGDGITSPGGDAIGVLTVTAANRLTFAGTLPDRTLLSQTVAVSKDGAWPFYASLYGGTGSIIAWLTVANDTQPVQAPPDSVSLIKTNNIRTIYYPAGFTNTFSVESSTQVPFLFGTPVISTSGSITFSSGNLTNDNFTQSYTMSTNNVFAADPGQLHVKLTFDKTIGYLNGSFMDPMNQKLTPLHGLLLPNANRVRGYFYTPTQTGALLLQGN